MLMLDPENDQGFSITSGDVVTEITDVDFPPKQTPAVGLAGGGAVLNNALYVLGEDGIIYGSDDGDGTAWSALNFIAAARDPDGGVYLAKHHDNLIAMGTSTIEVFYDAGNATGSPLSRRQDVSYNIGCVSAESVWEIGDRLFFAGVDSAGAIEVYAFEQFTPRKISTDTIDSFITQAVQKDGYSLMGSGFTAVGHDFYILTLHTVPSDISPELTLVYDSTVGLWYIWETTANDVTNLPLVAWTRHIDLSTQYGQGILSNGDLISVNDNLLPSDTLLASIYVDSGYVDSGYVVTQGAVGTDITLTVRTGMYDGGSNRYKYPSSIRYAGNRTPNSQTLTIKWADETNTFNTGRSQDMSINSKEHRLGRFQRRNHEITYAGSDKTWIEGLEMVFEVGNN